VESFVVQYACTHKFFTGLGYTLQFRIISLVVKYIGLSVQSLYALHSVRVHIF